MTRLLRSVVILALAAVTARGDDWPHGGRDDGRTRAPSETIVAPALLGSGVATGSGAVASPVAADGYIVVAGLDGRVRAYRESDRLLLWTAGSGSALIGTPLVDHGRVYVPTTDGMLQILRLETGASLGSVDTGSADRSSPVLRSGRVYMGSGFPNTSLLAINPVTKTIAWSAPLDQVTESSPAFGGGKVLIPTNNGTLAAFDEVTGAPIWTTAVGGNPHAAAPLILGTSAFLLSGATISRIALDQVDWGSNGSVTLIDPVTPPATTLDVDWAGSSLALAGGLLVGVVRFDYARDDLPAPSGDGYPDQWTLREYAFAVDPLTLQVVWQVSLGETTVTGINNIPPYGIVPAPVALGPSVAFASSVTPSVQLLAPANGANLGSLGLDAPCQASPFVANARVYALTRVGTLYAFQGSHAQPAAATGLAPSNVEVPSTPGTLTWNEVPSAVSYLVRIADDAEILMDWDHEFTVGTNSLSCPPLADGVFHTWGVRARDATGASSPWSVATFAQNIPPQPPGGLTATLQHLRVLLSWTPSPSAFATGYRLAYGPTGGPLGSTVDLGLVTSSTISGLTAGVSQTFQLQAMNSTGGLSTPVTVVATPLSFITVNGAGYETLQSAAAAALAGQTILLGDDTFRIDSTLLLPHGVELRGSSAFGTRIEASGPFVMIHAPQDSSVRMLSLSGGSVGVEAVGSSVTIANCVVRDMTDTGIVVLGVATAVNNTIVRNVIAGLRSSGRADARNNILQENGVGLTGVVTSRYNDVSDGYSVCLPGLGDLSSPVSFLNAGTGDYREQPLQASLDAGAPSDDYSQEPALNGGRINMGAFGNTPLAATSLTAGPPPPPSSPSSGACGLTGLEVFVLLAFLRRRR